MKRPIVLIGLISVVAALAVMAGAWWVMQQDDRPMPVINRSTIIIDEGQDSVAKASFSVSIARTPAEQSRGLSGVTKLEDGEGMYFPLDPAFPSSFWMKDMFMDIDIIWIKNGRIAQIEANVPAPSEEDNKIGQLETYRFDGSGATAVLEIRAGRAEELGLAVGDRVRVLSEVEMHH